MQVLLFLLLFFQCVSSCVPYRIPNDQLYIPEREISSQEDYQSILEARKHWLYQIVPRHFSQIYPYDLPHLITWSLFGNDDDGIFGEEATSHYSGPITSQRAVSFFIRNPLHNFCFYVIGTAYMKNSELTLLSLDAKSVKILDYQSEGSTDFASDYSGLFLGLHGFKPYLSLRLDHLTRSEFYIGWRSRGNFGLKFLPFRTKPVSKDPVEALGLEP